MSIRHPLAFLASPPVPRHNDIDTSAMGDENEWSQAPSIYQRITHGGVGGAEGITLAHDDIDSIGATVSYQIIEERLADVSVTVLSRIFPSLREAQLAKLRDGAEFPNTFLWTLNALNYLAPLIVIFVLLLFTPWIIRITIQTTKYIRRCCNGQSSLPPKTFRKKLE